MQTVAGGSDTNCMQMTTDGLCLHWLKGMSLRAQVRVWFCLCKYLMYPSGTKESKYPLERGLERWTRFTTGHEAVIARAEALYTHTARPRRRRGKIQNLRPESASEPDVTFRPLCVYQKPGPSCVWSSQLLHHLEPCLIYSLLRSSPTVQSPTYNFGNPTRPVLRPNRERI